MGNYVRSHDREEEWNDNVKCLVTWHCAPSRWEVNNVRQVEIPVPSWCAPCSREQRVASGRISLTFTLHHFTRSQLLHVHADFQTPMWSSPNGDSGLGMTWPRSGLLSACVATPSCRGPRSSSFPSQTYRNDGPFFLLAGDTNHNWWKPSAKFLAQKKRSHVRWTYTFLNVNQTGWKKNTQAVLKSRFIVAVKITRKSQKTITQKANHN